VILAAAVGVGLALLALPTVAEQLAVSLISPEPKAYWYLSRASAFVAFGLLWISMLSGMIVTNRMAGLWPGGPTALDLHGHASLLGLGAAAFHAFVLMGDRYINYSLREILVPFASHAYRPVWVGIGQVAIYLLALVTLSFYARRRLGNIGWRVIHAVSFLTFALALAHGIASGTDSGSQTAVVAYWISGGSLLVFFLYRVILALGPASHRPAGARTGA
jgi:predicted ferric reductase